MQPVTPRPVGGDTGGGPPGETLPPARPSFLEQQITAESLGEALRRRPRAQARDQPRRGAQVRQIFQRYLALTSVVAPVRDLKQAGGCSKTWIGKDG
jgi:hypothetical protein